MNMDLKTMKASSVTRKYEVIAAAGLGRVGMMRAAAALAYVEANGGAIYSREQYAGRGGRRPVRVDFRDESGVLYIGDYTPARGEFRVYA